jgi:hypothetical protein
MNAKPRRNAMKTTTGKARAAEADLVAHYRPIAIAALVAALMMASHAASHG